MVFLYEYNSYGGSGKKNKNLEEFEELKNIISHAPLGVNIGRYHEGEKDDMGRLLHDSFLELFYEEGGQLKEGMYRIRKTSVKQLEEVRNWINEGRLRKGHVNMMKYQNGYRKIIVI